MVKMSEIILRDSSENFLLPKTEFYHMDVSSNDSEKTISGNGSDDKDSTGIENTDITGENELDGNFPVRTFDSSEFKTPATETKASNVNNIPSDRFMEEDNDTSEYEIVSLNVKNMTQTTVINTTYNLISQSTVTDIQEKSTLQNNRSSFMQNDSFDKSRVVVQVLTSNSKNSLEAQSVENINNNYGYPGIYSFRDDVFKLLSKPQPSQLESDNSMNNIADNSTRKQASVDKNFKDVCSRHEDTNHVLRFRRKPSLKASFASGRGMKINEIKYVTSNLKYASPRLLRILHYILFDTYGPCNTGLQILQTKQNIQNFCGYPFEKCSKSFEKKKNTLLKLPFPILCEMYRTLISNNYKTNRIKMVSDLMKFLMKPKVHKSKSKLCKKRRKECSENLALEELKELVLKMPLPTVGVKRLSEDDIEKIKNQLMLKNRLESKESLKVESNQSNELQSNQSDSSSSYSLPAYILKGPGEKLKSFPQIAENVHSAKGTIIQRLHYILYGRIESENICKRNILEFSGFLPCQKEFTAERQHILEGMSHSELYPLCKIFCFQAKTNSRIVKIGKLMSYLRKPMEPLMYKYLIKRTEKPNFVRKRQKEKQDGSRIRYSKPNISSTIKGGSGPKLRDFKNICSNIECAAPSDLTELNDLLFVKPCDESEIHQRILDFTRFEFLINSTGYHYRKTLMHYMSFCIIRKIAQLLDIENWDKILNQNDLANNILSFLMELNLPASHQKIQSSKHVLEGTDLKLKSSEVKCENKKGVQAYGMETEANEGLQDYISTSSQSGLNLDHPYSADNTIFNTESAQEPIVQRKKSVFIHRISKANVQTPQCNPENEIGSVTDTIHLPDDDSTPLRAFLHHPSDQELKKVIKNIIEANLWAFTMRDLIQKVYYCYPDFNLKYRENFIKTETRKILSDFRSNAVDTLKNLQFKIDTLK